MRIHMLIILLVFSTVTCDEGSFLNNSLIDLEIEHIYPANNSVVPINTSVVATFNKPINKKKFKEQMMNITAFGGEKLDGEFVIQDRTVIFTPSSGFLMKAKTQYGVEISDLVDTDGNVLKEAKSCFTTSEAPDNESPFPVKATAQGNIAKVYFNEPLLNYRLQQDAITVLDLTTSQVITGTITGTNFSNIIVFTATKSFCSTHQYLIQPYENTGIIDLANNEIVVRPKTITIFPTPSNDTTPPFVKSITSDYVIQSITLNFSEIIDQFAFTDIAFNTSGFSKGVLIAMNKDTVPTLCPKNVLPYPLSSCTTDEIHATIVTLNEDQKSITIDITTTEYTGKGLYVVINKNAIKDLNGNRLIATDFIYRENDDYIIYICPAL